MKRAHGRKTPECKTLVENGKDWLKRGEYRKARECFERAAFLDEPEGVALLGTMYLEGKGVEVYVDTALELFRRAAALGRTQSMLHLGWLYEEGKSVPKDLNKAKEWYEKAAQAGDPAGFYNLAELYSREQDKSRAVPTAAYLYTMSLWLKNDRKCQSMFEAFLTEKKVLPFFIREHVALFGRNLALSSENRDLKKENEKLKAEIDLLYRPDGPGYLAARTDFLNRAADELHR